LNRTPYYVGNRAFTLGNISEAPFYANGRNSVTMCGGPPPMRVVDRPAPPWREVAPAPMRLIFGWENLAERVVIDGDYRRYGFAHGVRDRQRKLVPRASRRFSYAPTGRQRQTQFASRLRLSSSAPPPVAVTYGPAPTQPVFRNVGGNYVAVTGRRPVPQRPTFTIVPSAPRVVASATAPAPAPPPPAVADPRIWTWKP